MIEHNNAIFSGFSNELMRLLNPLLSRLQNDKKVNDLLFKTENHEPIQQSNIIDCGMILQNIVESHHDIIVSLYQQYDIPQFPDYESLLSFFEYLLLLLTEDLGTELTNFISNLPGFPSLSIDQKRHKKFDKQIYDEIKTLYFILSIIGYHNKTISSTLFIFIQLWVYSLSLGGNKKIEPIAFCQSRTTDSSQYVVFKSDKSRSSLIPKDLQSSPIDKTISIELITHNIPVTKRLPKIEIGLVASMATYDWRWIREHVNLSENDKYHHSHHLNWISCYILQHFIKKRREISLEASSIDTTTSNNNNNKRLSSSSSSSSIINDENNKIIINALLNRPTFQQSINIEDHISHIPLLLQLFLRQDMKYYMILFKELINKWSIVSFDTIYNDYHIYNNYQIYGNATNDTSIPHTFDIIRQFYFDMINHIMKPISQYPDHISLSQRLNDLIRSIQSSQQYYNVAHRRSLLDSSPLLFIEEIYLYSQQYTTFPTTKSTNDNELVSRHIHGNIDNNCNVNINNTTIQCDSSNDNNSNNRNDFRLSNASFKTALSSRSSLFLSCQDGPTYQTQSNIENKKEIDASTSPSSLLLLSSSSSSTSPLPSSTSPSPSSTSPSPSSTSPSPSSTSSSSSSPSSSTSPLPPPLPSFSLSFTPRKRNTQNDDYSTSYDQQSHLRRRITFSSRRNFSIIHVSSPYPRVHQPKRKAKPSEPVKSVVPSQPFSFLDDTPQRKSSTSPNYHDSTISQGALRPKMEHTPIIKICVATPIKCEPAAIVNPKENIPIKEAAIVVSIQNTPIKNKSPLVTKTEYITSTPINAVPVVISNKRKTSHHSPFRISAMYAKNPTPQSIKKKSIIASSNQPFKTPRRSTRKHSISKGSTYKYRPIKITRRSIYRRSLLGFLSINKSGFALRTQGHDKCPAYTLYIPHYKPDGSPSVFCPGKPLVFDDYTPMQPNVPAFTPFHSK